MNRNRLTSKVVALPVILFLVLAGSIPYASVSAATTTSNLFIVATSLWGTASAPQEVGPGSTNVPLLVTFQYVGTSTISKVQATLGLPAGVTDVFGNPQPVASTVSVQPNTAFSLSYPLTISQNLVAGVYPISVGLQWNYTSTTTPGFFIESHTFNTRILGTVQMSASSSQSSLNAGEVNNVTITLTNRGTGTATQINPTLSSSAGTVLNVLPVVPSLPGGALVSFNARVYVPVSSSGAAVTLTLASTYFDAYGATATSSLAVGFYAVTAPEPSLSFSAPSGSLVPGQVNDVVVVLTNNGPGQATNVRTTVGASGVSGSQSSGAGFFSILSQFPQVNSLAAGNSVNASVRVFAPASAAGSAATLTFSATFTDPYGYSQTDVSSLGLYTAGSTAVSAATALSVATTNDSLVAGQKSPVAFDIKNTGQQPVFAPSISLATSTPLVVSTNSSVTLAGAVINPGSTLVYAAVVTTGTSASGGFYAGTLTITFNDQFGDSHTQTFPVALVVTIPVSAVSVSSLLTQVGVGKTSPLSFMISNSGTADVYSPTFALSAPSGFAVTTNATFSRSGLVLGPGKGVKYIANVTAGPKTAEGAYIATLTVSYEDQFGNSHSSTFNMGFVAVGGIQMVVQDESVEVNSTSVTVSGTLLNEGLANAYYTTVTGTLNSGSTQIATDSTYIGEVDSNTPLPLALSLTIPARFLSSLNGTGTLTIVASYQNDFGTLLQFKNAQKVPLNAASSGGRTTSTAGGGSSGVSAQTLDIVRYASLGLIAVAAIATVLFVRRGRSKARKGGTKSDVY